MNTKKLAIFFILFSFFTSGITVWSMQKLYKKIQEKIKEKQWSVAEIHDIWFVLKNDQSLSFSNTAFKQFKQKFLRLGEIERRTLQEVYFKNLWYRYDSLNIADSNYKYYIPFATFSKASPRQRYDWVKKCYEEELSKLSSKDLKYNLNFHTDNDDQVLSYFIPRQEIIDLINNEITSLRRLKPQKGSVKKAEKS